MVAALRSLICLFALASFGPPLSAQQFRQELDSLSRLLDIRAALDPATVDLRNRYTRLALFADPSDTTLLDFAQETLEASQKLGYAKGTLQAYERMALVYQYSFSNPYKAQEYYHRALSLVDRDESLKPYGWSIYGGIGTLYYEQEEYGKALDFFEQVLKNDKALELTATANMANIHGSLGRLDSAIHYYNRALRLEQLRDNPTYRANLYSNLSLVYGQDGQVDSALAAAKKSLGLITEYGIEFVRPTAYANASMAYLGKGDYEMAEKYAMESLALGEAQGNLFVQKSAWGSLADLHSAKGDYLQALEAHKRFSRLKDSLNGQNRRVEINRKRMEFDFERERSLAQAEIRRQTGMKRASLLGGGGLLLATLFGFVLYKRRRDALERQKDAEFRALVSDTELKALRAQMNPHFIFNSLNSIGDYILKNDTTTAVDYLGKFARLMRMVLEHSEFKLISLADELKFIELYLQVEQKRRPGRFTFQVRVGDPLDPENILLPPLILQPFLENSIWHGFADQGGPGRLWVDIHGKGGALICVVEDDGKGLAAGTKGDHGRRSYGLSITQSRLELLNREKGSGASLRLGDREHGGTRVEVHLPLLTEF